MKAVALTAALGVGSWLVMAVNVAPPARLGTLLGMVGPLAAVTASWVVAERTYRLRPEALTKVMTAAFGIKVAFFAVYVTVMLRMVGVSRVPFVASFFGYFIAFYAIEAVYLRRLFR